MGFLRAIHQVLLMGPPTSSHGLPDLALDGAMLGLASQELLAITAILWDHQDQLVAEVEQRNPIVTRFPDLSRLEAAEMFVVDSSLLVDRLGDSRRPMFEQLDKFVPRDLLTDFPCAIRQVLLTEFPSSEQPLINVAMEIGRAHV